MIAGVLIVGPGRDPATLQKYAESLPLLFIMGPLLC